MVEKKVKQSAFQYPDSTGGQFGSTQPSEEKQTFKGAWRGGDKAVTLICAGLH